MAVVHQHTRYRYSVWRERFEQSQLLHPALPSIKLRTQ
jgi:hypothetical protein